METGSAERAGGLTYRLAVPLGRHSSGYLRQSAVESTEIHICLHVVLSYHLDTDIPTVFVMEQCGVSTNVQA